MSALFRWRCNISIHSPNSLPLRRVSQFFLKMCPPFVSLLVSALFRWPCSISVHLSPRSVTAGVRPFRWRCNISTHSTNSLPLRRVSQFFLKMCPPFVSLLVSALFRWPCSISVHLSPRSVTAGVRPFRWRCNISTHSTNSLPLRRVSQFFLKMCPPFVSLLVSAHSAPALLVSALSTGHEAFQFICFPCSFCTSPNRLLLGFLNAF